MPTVRMTRRSLAGMLGAAAGAALLDTRAARAATRASTRRGASGGFVRLNANENPYGPSSAALAAAARSDSIANRYPDALEDEVRQAIARLHGVSPERIVLGCGSSEILRMADMAFAAGKTVVVAEPTFEAVVLYSKAIRAEAVKVPLTADFRHDLPKMAAASDDKTGLVYICNPNNPTGTIVLGDELAAFAAKASASATILVDEAYHHFVEDPRYKSACDLIEKFPNVVVARTFSKIYGMAGLRLGYAIGSEAKIAEMTSFASWNNTNATVLSAVLASLADQNHVREQRKALNDTRRWLVAELSKDGRKTIPSETNFLMIDVGGDVVPVIRAFEEKKILVGRKFPSLPNWLRISIGTQEEMTAFLGGLRQIVPARAAA